MWLLGKKMTACLRALQKKAFLLPHHPIGAISGNINTIESSLDSSAINLYLLPSSMTIVLSFLLYTHLLISKGNRLVLLPLCTCAHLQGKSSCPSSSRHVLNHLVVAFGRVSIISISILSYIYIIILYLYYVILYLYYLDASEADCIIKSHLLHLDVS